MTISFGKSSLCVATGLIAAFAVVWLLPASAVAQGAFPCGGGHDEIQIGTDTTGPRPVAICTKRQPVANQPGGSEQARSAEHWETRWGAIAIGVAANGQGDFGTADGHKSKGKAKKAALADCTKRIGPVCKVMIEYHDQCGVLVSGDNFSTTARGPTTEAATEIGMKICAAKTSNCKAVHSGCSYPQRVR